MDNERGQSKIYKQPLTDSELRANPVPISGTVTATIDKTGLATDTLQTTGNTSLNNIDTNLGAKADASASSDTGTFSLIAFIKRALTKLTTISTTQTDGSQKAQIGFYDSANLDAFARVRVSEPANRFDGEFTYDTLEEIIDDVKAGAGTITHQANTRDVLLKANGTTTGDYAGLHSFPVPYTPGCSQLIEITGVLDYAAIGSGTAQLFLRSKITGTVQEEVYDQADWDSPNNDIDWTKSLIFLMDFQSLRVGRIRYGLVRNGVPTYVHEIINDNVRNSGYWQTPSLPLYWKIYNDSTYTYMEVGYGDDNNGIGFRYRIAKNSLASMIAICGTVKSEGGKSLFEMDGFPQSANSNVTAKTVSTTLIPLLSVRPRTTFNSIPNTSIAIPTYISVQTDNPIRIGVWHDATLTGASWADVDTNHSIMEYDTTASAFTGGHRILSEYVATSKNIQTSARSLMGKAVLWARKNGYTGILTVAAIRTTTTNASVLTSLNWEEIR